MQSSLAQPLRRNPLLQRKLVLITLLVLLVHGLLLGGLSADLRLWAGVPDVAEQRALRFVTRTVAPEPPPEAVALAPPPAPVRTAPRLASPKPVPPAAAPEPAVPSTPSASTATSGTRTSDAALAADPTPQAAAVTVGQGGAARGLPGGSAEPATALPGTPPQPAPGSAAPATKLLPPAPARLLFDGRGEERGFIKYAASAELLWQPVGDAYSARLELSTWGIRVRTWTSKGTLGETGLMPTRFGDKPRGAELATHFQRDKGIISFSANNPEVPLQTGAQDKLSALLQLSALVAGAPERYGPGTAISFQAADAHRAESWAFQVGALERLELPGGTLMGLKFSKEPSLEFDQRIEVWLAPDANYLPVRLRITEANGAYADLLWRSTQKPD